MEERHTLEYGNNLRGDAGDWLRVGGASYAGMAVGLVVLVWWGGDPEAFVYLPLPIGLLLVPAILLWASLWIACRTIDRTPGTLSSWLAFGSCVAFSSGAILLGEVPVIEDLLDFAIFNWIFYGLAYVALPFVVILMTTRTKSVLSVHCS